MNKILIIDDNPTIHQDIRKILCPPESDPQFSELEAELFDAPPETKTKAEFQVDSAFQGQEGFAKVRQALAEGAPYALAFVDVRMPPGWDGIETIRHIWDQYPELQVVICTAYSDRSWTDITRVLGCSDNLAILKKPFDNIELLQLAHALTRKWELNRQVQERLAGLDEMVRARTAELRASEERFQKAFQAASVPMAILQSRTQTCVEVNDSFLALTARQRHEIVGPAPARLEQLIPPGDYERLHERLRSGGPIRDYSCQVRRNCKEVRDTLISMESVTMGTEECLLLAVHDVTEQHQIEFQFRQAQKMEAVGQLAAGVAHDFNNLLTVIQGHASMQLSRHGLEPQTVKAFQQVQLAAERAAALTRHLLAFSRKQVMQRRPLRLNEILTRIQPMFVRMLGETISLDCQCLENLPQVLADENSIEQVLMNLVVNARDAMGDDGKLRIAAETVKVSAAAARKNPEARPGEFVRLIVADNGSGMDAATLARIFEPFFTTKPKNKGTGLGLSTVYGIVKQHEGWVEVDSTPRVGTVFRVFLPLSARPAEAAAEEPKASVEMAAAETPRETILLVEDEAPVRELMATTLTRHGYQVIQAENGPAALNLWQQATRPIDLLLTDMVMPNGLSGAALARRLLEKCATLRVLYTSGYSPELIENPDQLLEGVNFLPKPFDISKLIRTVRCCLTGTAEASLKPARAAA
ncbi:MAG: response regulator [Verrucomicrobiota bacterium]|nr:response regulator [Verrucomicrobiota bacterium]